MHTCHGHTSGPDTCKWDTWSCHCYCGYTHRFLATLLWQNLKVQLRQYQSPQRDAELSQFHPPPILTTHFLKTRLTNKSPATCDVINDERGPAINEVTNKLFCRNGLPVLWGRVLSEKAFKGKRSSSYEAENVVNNSPVAEHNGSTPLIQQPSQFYPPPILTTYFPKIHLTN